MVNKPAGATFPDLRSSRRCYLKPNQYWANPANSGQDRRHPLTSFYYDTGYWGLGQIQTKHDAELEAAG
jgi:hypothetical protein